jgi:arsenate reductase
MAEYALLRAAKRRWRGARPKRRRKEKMNIQIFGTSKSFDTKKAQRWFSERGIRVQYIDLKEKEMSRGEFDNVKQAVGGYAALIDSAAKDKQTLALLECLVEYQREDKLFENQHLLKTPIVRSGRKAAVGYAPEIWEAWLAADKK